MSYEEILRKSEGRIWNLFDSFHVFILFHHLFAVVSCLWFFLSFLRFFLPSFPLTTGVRQTPYDFSLTHSLLFSVFISFCSLLFFCNTESHAFSRLLNWWSLDWRKKLCRRNERKNDIGCHDKGSAGRIFLLFEEDTRQESDNESNNIWSIWWKRDRIRSTTFDRILHSCLTATKTGGRGEDSW